MEPSISKVGMKDDADRRELRQVALGHPVMPVACPCWLNGMAARMVLEPKPGTYALILSCSTDFVIQIGRLGTMRRKRPKLTVLTSEGEIGVHLSALWTLKELGMVISVPN